MGYYNDDDNNKIRRKKVSNSKDSNKKSKHYKTSSSKRISEKVDSQNLIKRDRDSFTRDNVRPLNTDYKQRERRRGEYKERETKLKSKKRKKQKRIKIVRALLSIMLVALIVFSVIGAIFTVSAIKGSPEITKKLIRSKYISSEVVSIKQMPNDLKHAIVSIEDERFYKHKGVDAISLVRSVLNNVFTDTTQGGSTIDMQVSKNLLTSDDKNMKRKIRDMYNAKQMNKIMTKDEILEAYLNNMYLGKNAYGAAKGAEVYFGKKVSELNLAECAMLAGMTNNPARYIDHGEAKKRQVIVLYKMHELGYITDKEYRIAKADDTPFKSEID
ncbi:MULTISPECIES: biosynthetic peptidoglycan transglycosylase [unclassified Clostridioides]|uniref:biosynthetic peptidoglycan transglycosylase n=1 Tax=unclassified Clostridioides TaxID=2635829 RepID=UPI001D11A2E2|nr:transglycosylase domain-containing protein [Clostridioides sp. ES-S-0171-01]MCC0687722.1 transglycosylase domain-containing protein [Clostridioides sp. ES-S-0056-01]MCC0716082.1 transglycosylase domain-containing protein [Clostridioides sp. ES-S-0077-01]UDN53543.1 transglycosylase domain-containing protein [Clostridioides sp. ES-S-0054-01]